MPAGRETSTPAASATPLSAASPGVALLYEPFVGLVSLGRYRPLVRRLVAGLDLAPGSRVLDLCCGTGLVTRAIAKRLEAAGASRARAGGTDHADAAGTVVGVDASPRMLELAQRRCSGPGCQVSFLLADAAALPLPTGSFDAATLFLGLHEIEPAARGAALGELRRILRPGGLGLALDFAAARSGLYRRLTRWALTALEGPEAWAVTDPGLALTLERAGFTVEARRPVFGGILEAVTFRC